MALVAYYKFDGNKNDSSGNGYDLSGPIYSYSNDGSWRIDISGSNLIFERRVTGSWTTKQTITG